MTFLDLFKEIEFSKSNNENPEYFKKYKNLFLTLLLNNEVYAISADRTEELIPLENIIITGNDPEYKKGFIRY
jgi:hypothetical protein